GRCLASWLLSNDTAQAHGDFSRTDERISRRVRKYPRAFQRKREALRWHGTCPSALKGNVSELAAEHAEYADPQKFLRSPRTRRLILKCTLREEVAMRTVMKILVPIDFTAPSDVALMYGRNLAKAFGADLHVLHVMENQFLRLTFKSAAAVEA